MSASPHPYVPPEGPPRQGPSRDIYARMGAENIYRMLEDFYAELERTELRPMFPEDMQAASRRSAAFFVQLLGGPPEYSERFGPPRMRQRHLGFPINERRRRIWMDCFTKVLETAPETYGFPPEHLPGFVGFLEAFSRWMVNQEG